MKKNNSPAPDEGPRILPVHFELTDGEAGPVHIAGTFNNWLPDSKPMHPVRNGHEVKDALLRIGNCEYCLMVNETFRADPLLEEIVMNPFSDRNSILRASEHSATALPFPATTFANNRRKK